MSWQNDTDKIVSNLREQISTLREKVAGDVSNKEDVIALQELVQELQLAKQQTWEERQKLSLKYEQERKTNLANQVRHWRVFVLVLTKGGHWFNFQLSRAILMLRIRW